MSAIKLVNKFNMDIDKGKYVMGIKDKFSPADIELYLEKLKNLNVLIIGDSIIDEYVFVQPKGRAVKDPILSVEYKNREVYGGGVLAISMHVSDYVNKIKLVTLVGDRRTKIDFIKKSLSNNTELKTFAKENSPTTLKKRYIDGYKNNKLFKIEFMNDNPISNDLTEEIVNYLRKELPKYNLVILGDFGHGFINNAIRDVIEEKSKFLSINVQSNSANMGYNYINHYRDPDFIVINEDELRLPLMKRFEELQDVIREFHNTFKYNRFLVTLGKKGCMFFNQGNVYKAPIFTNKVVDTVGAGDAVFAITSLFAYLNVDDQLMPFIANCAGGIKVMYMGNKESITKERLLNFIKEVHKNELE